jgi:hypothetical protein
VPCAPSSHRCRGAPPAFSLKALRGGDAVMTAQEPAVDGRASWRIRRSCGRQRSQPASPRACARGRSARPACRESRGTWPYLSRAYAMPSLVRSASRSRSHSASAATRCRNMHRCRSWSRSSGPAGARNRRDLRPRAPAPACVMRCLTSMSLVGAAHTKEILGTGPRHTSVRNLAVDANGYDPPNRSRTSLMAWLSSRRIAPVF